MHFAIPRIRAAAAFVVCLFLLGATPGCKETKISSTTASGSLDIISLSASPDTIFLNQQSIVAAVIDNPTGQKIIYSWQAYRGAVAGDGPAVRYFGAYCCAGTDWVVLTVTDESGGTKSKSVVLHVYDTVQ